MQFSLPKVEDNFLEPPKSFSAVEQISFRKKSATLKGRQLPLDLQAVLPLDLCALEKQHDSIVFYCPVFYSVLHTQNLGNRRSGQCVGRSSCKVRVGQGFVTNTTLHKSHEVDVRFDAL